MERAERYGTVLTCLMVDIDKFKQINDNHGHLVGDRVLRQLANLLKREQRAVDVLARYGGEEFVVLLPETGRPVRGSLPSASSAGWRRMISARPAGRYT